MSAHSLDRARVHPQGGDVRPPTGPKIKKPRTAGRGGEGNGPGQKAETEGGEELYGNRWLPFSKMSL
jgi:hypothetical protein